MPRSGKKHLQNSWRKPCLRYFVILCAVPVLEQANLTWAGKRHMFIKNGKYAVLEDGTIAASITNVFG